MKTTTKAGFSVVAAFGAGATKAVTLCAMAVALVGAAACDEGVDSADEAGDETLAEASDEAIDAPATQGEDVPAVRKLRPEQIQRVVRGSFGGFRSCYEKLLKTSPTAAGKVTMHFRIGPDGTISDARAESTFEDTAIGECITGRFEKLQFETQDDTTTVTYPIAFSPD